MKVESIRPGGALESSFVDYPLPDLLLGILRGNVTGALGVALGSEPRNHVYFRDGVPTSVTLPDLGVSLAELLAEQGELPRDRASELARRAEDVRQSESRVIFENELLPPAAVNQGRRLRAREQLIRLFDVHRATFRFIEGILQPPSAALTILQPLPIAFEGLRRSRDRRVLQRFVEEHGSSTFRLTVTYPRGVDPFEWGTRIEQAVTEGAAALSLAELEACAVERRDAEAVLACLYFVGMTEVVQAPRAAARSVPLNRVEPGGLRAPGPAFTPQPSAPKREAPQPEGLVVVRRTAMNEEARRVRVEAAPVDARPMTRVAQVLSPHFDKSYYELLRVPEGATPEQVERALRQQTRNLRESDPEAHQAMLGQLEEAAEHLADPVIEPLYRGEPGTSEGERRARRHALEAEHKLTRALTAMIEARFDEAECLLEWMDRLEPGRSDRRAVRGLLGYYRAPKGIRAVEAKAVRQQLAAELARAPGDERLERCLRLLNLEESDPPGRSQSPLAWVRQALQGP